MSVNKTPSVHHAKRQKHTSTDVVIFIDSFLVSF